MSKWANADAALTRYIGLLSNITFDMGVKENSQKWRTSERAKSLFSQVGSSAQILKVYVHILIMFVLQVKKSEVKKLFEVYKNDFKLFDYDPTEFIDIASSG